MPLRFIHVERGIHSSSPMPLLLIAAFFLEVRAVSANAYSHLVS
jgi:hypothetical protein